MQYTAFYPSPLGRVLLASDDQGLVGLWFEHQKYEASTLQKEHQEEPDHPLLTQARLWLDKYFQGQRPENMPPLHLLGTPYQVAVWEMLLRVPYGETTTYGALAKELSCQSGAHATSARAVGNAVGHNPLSIFVPCHRVIGADGRLTGYAGGIERKIALLKLEKPERPLEGAIRYDG